MDTHSVILTTRENSDHIRVKGLELIVTIKENTDYIWVFFYLFILYHYYRMGVPKP